MLVLRWVTTWCKHSKVSIFSCRFHCPLSHLKSFIESVVPPIRLFLMIIMLPLKRCVAKDSYLIALLRRTYSPDPFSPGKKQCDRGKIGGGSASVVVEKYEKANSIFNISVIIQNKWLKFFSTFMLVYTQRVHKIFL